MENKKSEYSKIYKVILVGNSMVGKTCILSRYFDDRFYDKHLCTIGVDMRSSIYIKNEEKIKINFFDTSGVNRFDSMVKFYLKGAQGAIFVFSFDDRKSFDSIKYWIETYKSAKNRTRTTMLLLGNKCDLLNQEVTFIEGEMLGMQLGIEFFVVSSKTGDGIINAFSSFIEKIIDSSKPIENKLKLRLRSKKHVRNKNKICQT